MNAQNLFDCLNKHEFTRLFVEELGWSNPTNKTTHRLSVHGNEYSAKPVAELGGVVVLQIAQASIPDGHTRLALHREVAKLHREHLLIFTDAVRTQSLWYWVKREDGKLAPRSHLYVRDQPVDLFLAKLQAMQFELAELDEEGKAPVTEVAQRLKSALDVEAVTKRFFREFERQHVEFLEFIEGVPDDRDRHWYASVLLNRLMFVWFLQKKGFLDNGDYDYLSNKFAECQKRGPDRFYSEYLQALFFEGFAKPEDQRSPQARALLGRIRYLNGGLFLPHAVELRHAHIRVPDRAFDNLFKLFGGYSWNLDDRPGGKSDEINPDVLGYIFEKYINRKAYGAYYTRPEITRYLCEQTIHRVILDRLKQPAVPELKLAAREFGTLEELLLNLDASLCRELLFEVLPKISLLDPACGSGAFLVAAMKTLVNVYGAVLGRISVLKDATLNEWRKRMEGEHKNVGYHIHKAIITDNLYGVDIMEEAVEIARLRLFLALVACAHSADEIEPLPNIDFNILPGNSLIGLLHVDGAEFDARASGDLFRKSYREVVDAKNRAIDIYRRATDYAEDLRALRDDIETHHREARDVLGQVLTLHFADAGVRFEQSTWDLKANQEGRPVKRAIRQEDIASLKPFHWGYEFDQIMARGGFDVIIANPPWETLKPEAKEFFSEYSNLVRKKKMNVKDFEKEQAKLLKDPETRAAWLEYLSRFPHQSSYFRSGLQFKHQSTVVAGKRTGSDVNLYKLFVEQCFSLLRVGGRCGIVVPSGLYTDLAATGLRRLLFNQAQVSAMLSISNERFLFEGVHHSFRYVFLTYQKGGQTTEFDAAFRINPREAVGVDEIDAFLNRSEQHLRISMDLVRQLSPETLSVMEFRSALDVSIAQKLLRHPVLGEKRDSAWNFKLTNEIHISNDREHLKTAPTPTRLPLFTGKMFNQFTLTEEHSGYWLEEITGRMLLLGKSPDTGQALDYKGYRFVHRRIARNTDSRTFIASMTPPNVFTEVNSTVLNVQASGVSNAEQLYLCAVCNSLTLDWMLRQKVAATLNMFYIYQLPVPRLTVADPSFAPIVQRAARLICTTPEFDDLWRSVSATIREISAGERGKYAATDPAERGKLRAELDGLIAHLYDLTEVEFTHILGAFPLVAQPAKDATLAAFRAFAPKTADLEAAALIAGRESASVEFKSTSRWNIKEKRVDRAMEQVIVKTVAAFMNAQGGDLFIGVDDGGHALGLVDDLRTLGKRADRDGYENWLTTLLLDSVGKEFTPNIAASFPVLQGHEICRVQISASSKPAYIDGKLFVRAGNTTRELNPREAVEYVQQRWP
jgi:hypothetical protein